MTIMRLMERLRAVRLEKERVALSLLSLSLFAILYALGALASPIPWRPALLALALCYGLGFFALASQWFWARWFVLGLAWSGATLGLASLVMVGWHPFLALYGGPHALVLVLLAGPPMVLRFEMQTQWRERYAMDEFAVARLGRIVTRASTALPSLIMWALAPREGQGAWGLAFLGMTCALAGWAGILRLRTWGIFSLGTSAALTLAGLAFLPSVSPIADSLGSLPWAGHHGLVALAASLILFAAIAPVSGALRRAWRAP